MTRSTHVFLLITRFTGNISILPLKTPYVVARRLVPRRSLLIRCPREVWERAHLDWLLYQIIRCTKFSRVVLEERGKRHVLVMMFKVFKYNNWPTYLRQQFRRTSEVHNYHYLNRIFLSVHSLIGLQWLVTNRKIKHVR